MIITLLVKKTGWGQNQLIYPACDKSKTFSKIYSQKTFTQENLQDIKSLGFSIIYKY